MLPLPVTVIFCTYGMNASSGRESLPTGLKRYAPSGRTLGLWRLGELVSRQLPESLGVLVEAFSEGSGSQRPVREDCQWRWTG
jgi:hypothetical protein